MSPEFERWFVFSQLTDNFKEACWAAWEGHIARVKHVKDLQELMANCEIYSLEWYYFAEQLNPRCYDERAN